MVVVNLRKARRVCERRDISVDTVLLMVKGLALVSEGEYPVQNGGSRNRKLAPRTGDALVWLHYAD